MDFEPLVLFDLRGYHEQAENVLQPFPLRPEELPLVSFGLTKIHDFSILRLLKKAMLHAIYLL